MISLNFKKQIGKWVLDAVDKKFGKIKIGGVKIDSLTDIFQGQDNKIRDLELRMDALEHFLKDNK